MDVIKTTNSVGLVEIVSLAIRDSFNSNDVDCYPIAKAALKAIYDFYDDDTGERLEQIIKKVI